MGGGRWPVVGRRPGASLPGGAVGGRRIDPPPDLPPSRGERRGRRFYLLPPFLPPSGGRSGGGSPVQARGVERAAGLSPPAPLPGGRREGGATGRALPGGGGAGGGERGIPPAPLPGGRDSGGRGAYWPAARTVAADRPPSRPPPFQGGGEMREGGCVLAGGGDLGEAPDALTLWLLPPSGGRSGGGSGGGVGGRRGIPPGPLPGGREGGGGGALQPPASTTASGVMRPGRWSRPANGAKSMSRRLPSRRGAGRGYGCFFAAKPPRIV